MNSCRVVTRKNIEIAYETAVSVIEQFECQVCGEYSLNVTENTVHLLLDYCHPTLAAVVKVLWVRVETA